MATTRFKFRASSVSGKQGTLFIQVVHQRVVRQVSTKYKLYPKEWNATGQSVVFPKDTFPPRSQYLQDVQEALQHDVARLQLIILSLDHSRKAYEAMDVVERFLKEEPSDDFQQFAERIIDQKKEEGHLSIAAKYRSSLNSLNRFLDGRPLTFDDMNASQMLRYETYLKKTSAVLQHHLFLYAQPACHLQSSGEARTYATEPSLLHCLYRHSQNREACCQCQGVSANKVCHTAP